MIGLSYSIVSLANESEELVISQNEAIKLDKTVDFRVPSSNIIDKFRADKRFQYENEVVKEYKPPVENWFTRFIEKIIESIITFFSYLSIKWILVGILVLALILIVFRFAKFDFNLLLKKQKAKTEIESYLDEEDIDADGIESDIQQAIEAEDFRMAVRLLFIKNLKFLSDREIIDWNKNKTNQSYVNEISEASMRKRYADSCYIFDYVWYGEFEVNKSQFDIIHTDMQVLYSKIESYA